jgi:hypothetical protein
MKFDLNMDVFTMLISTVVFIVWLARLEFLSNQNKKDIETLSNKHDDLGEELRKELSDMSKSLARIEGFLSKEKN